MTHNKTLEFIFDRITQERKYQTARWGEIGCDDGDSHSIDEWIDILWRELEDTSNRLMSEHHSTQTVIASILKVVTVGVACMQEHGCYIYSNRFITKEDIKKERLKNPMPKGTKVDKVYEGLLKAGKSKAEAAKIAQAQTGKSLATGKKPKGKK